MQTKTFFHLLVVEVAVQRAIGATWFLERDRKSVCIVKHTEEVDQEGDAGFD